MMPIEPRTLVKLVALVIGESIATLRGDRRYRRIVYARQVAMWLCRNVAGLSYPEVGLALGGKDHSTAMFACRAVVKDIQTDGPRAALVVAVIERAARGDG
jgi:chromosomal replication initiator protein